MRSIEKTVPREKYESIKKKGLKWHREYELLKEKVEDLNIKLEDMTEMNNDLLEKIEEMALNPQIDTNSFEQLEDENKALIKEIRHLNKIGKIQTEKHREKLLELERELFVKDGKIQRLEDAKKDIKERYAELKEDWRAERQNNRKKE